MMYTNDLVPIRVFHSTCPPPLGRFRPNHRGGTDGSGLKSQNFRLRRSKIPLENTYERLKNPKFSRLRRAKSESFPPIKYTKPGNFSRLRRAIPHHFSLLSRYRRENFGIVETVYKRKRVNSYAPQARNFWG